MAKFNVGDIIKRIGGRTTFLPIGTNMKKILVILFI